jgi:hypothetical protein
MRRPRSRARSENHPRVSALRCAMVLAACTGVALCGCGSANKSLEVASVQGREISRTDLAHWTRIKRLEQRGVPARASRANSVQLQRDALAFLITADWLQAEAKVQGIRVSPSEVDGTYRRLLSAPTGPSFATSLRRRGITGADERLLLRLQQLSNKLQAKIANRDVSSSPAQRERQVTLFAAAYRQRWKQRTTCQRGYIVPECRNGPPLQSSAH